MKKLAMLLALAVVCSLSAFAQTGTSGTSSSSGTTGTETQTTTTKTTKKTKATKAEAGESKAAAGAKESQLTGCLAKDAAGTGYMLTNGHYKKGVEVKSSEDISAHVGHQVKVMGTWEKPASGEAAGAKGQEMRTFNATKLDHIADTCKTAAASGEKKGKKGAPAAEKAPGF